MSGDESPLMKAPCTGERDPGRHRDRANPQDVHKSTCDRSVARARSNLCIGHNDLLVACSQGRDQNP